MLEVAAAQKKICEQIQAIDECESIPLSQALGRVLATPIHSTINVPPTDNSAMDGFAMNTDDISAVPCTLPVSMRIPAGVSPEPLASGSAARIFTGAEIPKNANAVVMQENCEYPDAKTVSILKASKPGENIRHCGQDINAHQEILSSGHRLKAQDIGLIASVGIAQVNVARKVKVGLLSTGDELVNPGTPLPPGKIYNSNQFMLDAKLRELGCDVLSVPITPDDPQKITAQLDALSKTCDLIISSGGVSVGEEDHVKNAVSSLGELNLWKVKVKPGKPIAFGKIGQCAFMGLPGNPVSAFVTFFLFGNLAIKYMQGQPAPSLKSMWLPLGFAITKARKRPEYLRVKLGDKIEAFPNQSSGVLSSVSWADALALIPSDKIIDQGELVEVFPLDQ